MALKIYDTLVPQGDYPAVKAEDVLMPDGKKLSELEIPESSGGVSSWNDLTDKPFYEEEGTAVILEERELTLSVSARIAQLEIAPAPFVLVDGETYQVVLDGVGYELVCTSSDGIPALQYAVMDENGEATSGTFQIVYASQEVSEVEKKVKVVRGSD